MGANTAVPASEDYPRICELVGDPSLMAGGEVDNYDAVLKRIADVLNTSMDWLWYIGEANNKFNAKWNLFDGNYTGSRANLEEQWALFRPAV